MLAKGAKQSQSKAGLLYYTLLNLSLLKFKVLILHFSLSLPLEPLNPGPLEPYNISFSNSTPISSNPSFL